MFLCKASKFCYCLSLRGVSPNLREEILIFSTMNMDAVDSLETCKILFDSEYPRTKYSRRYLGLEGRLQQEGREIAYLEHHNLYFPWGKFKRNRVKRIRLGGTCSIHEKNKVL
jgi:hypothetical protein